MTSKSNTVAWGALTLDVNVLRTGAATPHSEGTAITATADEINLAADISANGAVESIVAASTTYQVLAANSGRIHVWPDLTATCTVTLPPGSAGLTYEFWYTGIATDAQNLIVVPEAGEFFTGGVLFANTSAAATTAVYGDGTTDDTFTIVTPAGGTWFKMTSNGLVWYMTGQVVSATVCTIA
jgi:hypothetical protein